MKPKFALIMAFLALYLLPIEAKKVSPQKAETVASQLLSTQQNSIRSNPKPTLVYTEYENGASNVRSASNNNEATYYVFSNGNNNGFIIISADDVVPPILGYTTTGDYDKTNIPINFAEWTKDLSDQIAYAINDSLEQTAETKNLWDSYLSGNTSTLKTRSSVEPLIATKWDQDSPYNNLCPSGTYTGCVATAMAQIMKFYNYPAKATSTLPGYTTTSKKYVIDAVPASNYAWSDMLNIYVRTGTDAEKAAVAKLMYDCGVSVSMDYTSVGSGAISRETGKALISYFDYDKSIQIKAHDYYSKQEWDNILYNEIDSGRPVYYSGRNSSGHAFVCDGYNELGYFHFNWGWSGYCDGYFITSALNPGTGGAGSGAGTYNLSQEIIFNIKPNKGGEGNPELTLSNTSGITTEKSTLDIGENFTVNGIIWNTGFFNFAGEYGIALVDKDDNITAIAGQSQTIIGSRYGIYIKYLKNTIPTSLTPGNYYLRVIVKQNKDSDWKLLNSGGVHASKIPILITGQAQTHSVQIKNGSALSSTVITARQDEEFQVSAQFINGGNEQFEGDLGVVMIDEDEGVFEVIGTFVQNVYIDSGSYTTVPFTATCRVPSKIGAGNYKIRAVAKPTGLDEWSVIYGQDASVVDILDLILTNKYAKMAFWNPVDGSTDWFSASNWGSQVPDGNTDVYIYEGGVYPILTAPAEANNIYIDTKAELGRQDYLTYNKVFITYDLDAPDRTMHYRMYSLPLMEAYPGDFTFGGKPDVYFKILGTNKDGNPAWVNATGGNLEPLTAGSGFVLAVDPNTLSYSGGLAVSEGYLRLPFFDEESGVQPIIHPNHTYNDNWVSTFTNPYGTGSYSVIRSQNAYHIAGGVVNEPLKYVKSGNSYLALVGNPFLSSIDFGALYQSNSETIKNTYQIYTRVDHVSGYAGYNPDGNFGLVVTPELDKYIAPTQGFLIEGKDPTKTNLVFDITKLSSDKQAIFRSSPETGNKISIVASNENASVKAFIAKRNYGSKKFGENDSRKYIDSLTFVPEVYTLKYTDNGLINVAANITKGDDVDYPIGLATAYNGYITFSFSGMDTYTDQVYFTDKVLNKTINLSGLGEYEYTFSYTAPNDISGAKATNDRFSLRTVAQTSSIVDGESRQYAPLNIYATQGNVYVTSSGANPIKEVSVYNLAGAMIYRTKVNATSFVSSYTFIPGSYVVKVQTNVGIEHKKLLIK